MSYQWRIPGKYYCTADAAGAEIELCANEDGFVSPSAVVERAKAPTSAIHTCFEWDNKTAADRYRIHQAGELIRNIVVVVDTTPESPPVPVRAFVNIKGDSERGYKSITAVVNDPGEYAYMLACAKNELEAFSRKYVSLAELRSVMDAIREVLE